MEVNDIETTNITPLNNKNHLKKNIVNIVYQKSDLVSIKENENNIFRLENNLNGNNKEIINNELKSNLNSFDILKYNKSDRNPYFDFFPTEIKDLNEKESKMLVIGHKNKRIKIQTKSELLENKFKKRKDWKLYRKVAGKIWKDDTLKEWKEDDYRIWVGNLGNEVKDNDLALAFSKYGSLLKAKVVIDKKMNKSKGYGFVSFDKPEDYAKAMKEMNNCHIGNRPVKLQRGKWKNRSVKFSKSKIPAIKFIKKKANNNMQINI